MRLAKTGIIRFALNNVSITYDLTLRFIFIQIKLTFFSDGTRVTEPCTSSLDTCVDSYADCNGTICDCMSGFTWNGALCRIFSVYIFKLTRHI